MIWAQHRDHRVSGRKDFGARICTQKSAMIWCFDGGSRLNWYNRVCREYQLIISGLTVAD